MWSTHSMKCEKSWLEIIQTDPDVEILNTDLHLAHLDRHGRLDMEMEVNIGRGYAIAEMHKSEEQAIGVLPIDSDFNPITTVSLEILPISSDHSDTLSELVMKSGRMEVLPCGCTWSCC